MSLQWSTASSPDFDAVAEVSIDASKDLGGGEFVEVVGTLSFGGETELDSAAVLAYAGVVYSALVADGWTLNSGPTISEKYAVTRQIEDV